VCSYREQDRGVLDGVDGVCAAPARGVARTMIPSAKGLTSPAGTLRRGYNRPDVSLALAPKTPVRFPLPSRRATYPPAESDALPKAEAP
jgi:hypothetical protein